MSFNRTSWLLFVGLLLFAVTSSAGMVEDIQSKDKAKQEKAVREFVKHPDKYKTEMMAYIKSMTEKGKLPPEAILYAVGFTIDKDYFPYIYKMLAFDEIESECIYGCAPVFAAVLTSNGELGKSERKSKTTAESDYESETPEAFSKESHAEHRDGSAYGLVQYADEKYQKKYDDMLGWKFKKLLKVLKEKRSGEMDLLSAVTIMGDGERGEKIEDAIEMLLLLLQMKNDSSDGIHGPLRHGITALLIELDKRKRGACKK